MGKESDKFMETFTATFNDLVAYSEQLETGYAELVSLLDQKKDVSDEMVSFTKGFAQQMYGSAIKGKQARKAGNTKEEAEKLAVEVYNKDPAWLRLEARLQALDSDVTRELKGFRQFAAKGRALQAKAAKTLVDFEKYVKSKESVLTFWKSKKSVPASKAFIQKAKTDLAKIRLPELA
jgi:hypothetical protein